MNFASLIWLIILIASTQFDKFWSQFLIWWKIPNMHELLVASTIAYTCTCIIRSKAKSILSSIEFVWLLCELLKHHDYLDTVNQPPSLAPGTLIKVRYVSPRTKTTATMPQHCWTPLAYRTIIHNVLNLRPHLDWNLACPSVSPLIANVAAYPLADT